jgi:uncharacterized membrane protein YfcA
VLTPLLILLYPGFAPEEITAVSLSVVLANAASGSVAYARQRRIDYLAAGLFAGATVPGAVVGALATGELERGVFEAAFGALLLTIATVLLLPQPTRIVTTRPPGRYVRRVLEDAESHTYAYSFDPVLGVAAGAGIGFLSSLFGVGGGIIFVPVMVLLMRFPAYIATATSTFILIFTAGAGVAVHALAGNYGDVLVESAVLVVGVLIGAQVGARLSMRLEQRQAVVSRLLSVALIIVGVRLVAGAVL